ncbi:MAG TPA: alpha/beta hydrolase [Nocardioidaceae bacterium]|nr:alpha/beta hydrolase [Nocardioidaceae bacterium]
MPSPKTSRLARAASAVALPVVLLLTVSGCGLSTDDDPGALPSPTLSPSPLESPSASATPPEPDLDRYYAQKPSWKTCRSDKLCATIEVPLDYADPGGKAIELSLLKVPAAKKSQRVGSLVVNPGGPGGSGINYAAQTSLYFGSELQQAFDIIGFDPRGVGESTPVHCLSDDELDEFVATDPDPDNAAEIEQGDEMLAEFGEGCVEESGALASHVSTVEAAKDIDIIRAVVGDRKLSYFGASYGTFLGATYADLFPKRVGRMVLDGAIDPSLSTEETNLVQAKGFETALRAYVGHCVDAGDCFLGSSVDAGTQRIREFLDAVEARPITGSGDRQLTVGNAVLGIWAPLYNEGYWPILDTALKAAFGGNGAALLALSDAYTSRGPSGYVDNSLEALYAVNCLDHDDSIPAEQVPAHIAEFEKASPTFGAIFAFGLSSCSEWPVHTGRVPAPIHAKGAAPILVVGTTRDPATPLEWAEALAGQLQSGILVRRDGDGHTGYHAGNACVDNVVESYLVSGKVPEHEVDC